MPFFLLPILNGLFVWLMIEVVIWMALKNPGRLLGDFKITEADVSSQLEGIDWKKELDPLVNKRLENFVEGIKRKIPMAALFLSDSLVETLKAQAKEEIFGMLPEFQQMVAKQVSAKADLNKLLAKIDRRLIHRRLLWVKVGVALAGASLGVFESFIF